MICKEVQAETEIPIGKPIPGIHAYVVAKGGQRVPAGAAGELLVAGEQVGDGYLGRPDKTAEVFADNQYEDDKAYRRLYRTGDVVRYRADGDIEFIGRKDSQVKIRGFRIELKEVETVIREFEGIKDVTVQAFDEAGGGGPAGHLAGGREIYLCTICRRPEGGCRLRFIPESQVILCPAVERLGGGLRNSFRHAFPRG